MAKSTALQVIVKQAKSLKKKFPHRFDKLKKADRWPKGFIKQASADYKKGKGTGRKKVGAAKKVSRSAHKKKVAPKKVSRSAHKKSAAGRKLVKYVERTSTERVMAGKKRRRAPHTIHRAGRRSVGKSEGSGIKMLLGLVAGGALVYFLTKKSTPTTSTYQLPPIQQTSNLTRNTQSQNIVNYATAAGLAINAITSLIDRLNNSTDEQVNDIYDSVNTTGDVGYWV